MADQAKMTAEELKSLKTVFIGSNLIFWIISIFLIWILYGVNQKLTQMNQHVRTLMSVASTPGLDSYRVVDPEDEENVIYIFQRIPMPEDEYGMPGEYGEMPEGDYGTEAPAEGAADPHEGHDH